jgi:hypothetical protein
MTRETEHEDVDTADTDTGATEDEYEAAFAEATGNAADEPDPEPEDKDTGDDDPGTQTAGHEDKAPENPDDLWADAPEPLRRRWEAAQQELEKERQSARSNAGRIAAYQRQISELQNRMAAFEQNAAGKRTASDQDAGSTDDDWKAIKEEYPELVGPIERRLASIAEENATLKRELSAYSEERRDLYLQEQQDALTQQHADWQDVVGSSDFLDWYTAQPAEVRSMVEKNADAIVDAQSAAYAINLFKMQTGFQNAAPAKGTPTNDAAKQKRQRQLQDGAGAAGRGPGRMSGPPDDFEAAFTYFAGKK